MGGSSVGGGGGQLPSCPPVVSIRILQCPSILSYCLPSSTLALINTQTLTLLI